MLGAIAIELRVAVVTVSVAALVTDPSAAVIVVMPVPTEVARPLEPCTLLIKATVVDEELQTTDEVMSWVVRSL